MNALSFVFWPIHFTIQISTWISDSPAIVKETFTCAKYPLEDVDALFPVSGFALFFLGVSFGAKSIRGQIWLISCMQQVVRIVILLS